MAKYILELDDEVVEILSTIAAELGLPAELSVEESLELAVDALAMSYDAVQPSVGGVESAPVDAKTMADAVRQALEVDISIPVIRENRQGDLDL